MSNLSGKKLDLGTKTGARAYVRNMAADVNVNTKAYQNSVLKRIDKLKVLDAKERTSLKARVKRIKPDSAWGKK